LTVKYHCQCLDAINGTRNSGIYAERLIAEYGEQTIAELRVRSEQVKKFTIIEIEDIIEKYKELLKELKENA